MDRVPEESTREESIGDDLLGTEYWRGYVVGWADGESGRPNGYYELARRLKAERRARRRAERGRP